MIEESNRGSERQWHLDRRLNISHIITTLSLAVGLVVWAGAMDRRVAVLEERAAAQRLIDDRQDADMLRALNLIKEESRLLRDELRDQGRKLDRMIERLPNHVTRRDAQ